MMASMNAPSVLPSGAAETPTVRDHAAVQGIARETMEAARASLSPGQTLYELRAHCEHTLRELGADSFWYWGIGALVLSGEGTLLSVSGREYRTPDSVIRENDIITIDLSPERHGVWGDFARTLVIEDGAPLDDARDSTCSEWSDGIDAEHALHEKLIESAAPDMSFDELAEVMNGHIAALGYENLDFLGNLGHSIEQASSARIYLEPGNGARLDSVELFTFEPHIRARHGRYGYKHENIYRFVDGQLTAI